MVRKGLKEVKRGGGGMLMPGVRYLGGGKESSKNPEDGVTGKVRTGRLCKADLELWLKGEQRSGGGVREQGAGGRGQEGNGKNGLNWSCYYTSSTPEA